MFFQELCAENNLHEPKYILIQDIGPPHAKIFTIRCKMSNFEEDGIATTKKQAKHDAAKRMVDKIKSLMNKPKNKEDSSNSSITTIDIDTMNKNAEERYHTLTKSRKINLGLKLADYHTYWRDSLETDKRDKILEQLECVFPNEMIDIDYIIEDDIMEKISQLETILSEIDITINMNDVSSDKYCIKSIQLNTCPLLTQFGMGRNNLEASWEALSRIIQSIKLLLS